MPLHKPPMNLAEAEVAHARSASERAKLVTSTNINDKDIPIFIIQRDRLEYLKLLLAALTTRGYSNLHIVDNQSTYPPLLEYYKTLASNIKMHMMGKNGEHHVLVQTDVLDPYYKDWYAYTDNDIVPDEKCPDDFMSHFKRLLEKYPSYNKVGFGLRIDDIPESSGCGKSAAVWESQFWHNALEPGVYAAPIDTTFALCRPGAKHLNPASIRTGPPYVARHMPWYTDHSNVPEDVQYYVNHMRGTTHWNPPKKS